MPKMKSNRGAKKRFKLVGGGKFKHRKANRNHILTKKGTKRKRQLRKDKLASSADTPRIQRMCRGG
ncbi:MAG: 50S ribosomal protein L35 [Gammaproteobacteria bacterium]|nr:50S ribosomal protein L35 [Gammaproteobacteria bacterium]